MFDWIHILVMLIALLYAYHLERNRHFFLKRADKLVNPVKEKHKISIVIAARNEAENLEELLDAVRQQNYPTSLFELFIVDDDSEDNSLEILERYQQRFQDFQLHTLSMDKTGETVSPKQAALKAGIAKASGSIIATSDADCIMGANWLSEINAHFQDEKCMLLLGAVLFHKEVLLFEKLQSLEFLSIMGMTAGAAFQKKATMCNGANLAYRKTLFEDANIYEESSLASGDDVFLLFNVKKTHPNGIVFSTSEQHLVCTKAQASFRDFIQQRKRWASKTRAYKDTDALYSGAITLLSNLFFFVLSFLWLFEPSYFKLFLIVVLCKGLVDYRLTRALAKHYHRKRLLRYFIPEFLIYAYYVILVALLSLDKSYSWKGRKLQ